MNHYLFSYGTLQDPAIGEIIFERILEGKNAVLKGWRLYTGKDGYFFVKPETGFLVRGMILELSEEELRLADCWEEVPIYSRETVLVENDSGIQFQAYIYAKLEEMGTPAEGVGYSMISHEEAKAEAVSFKRKLVRNRESDYNNC